MIRINGKPTSRSYEDIGANFYALAEKQKQYQFHLNILGSDSYRKFRDLKADHDAGAIETGTYREYLKPIKKFLDENPAPYAPELNVEELQAEIKKFQW